jgi:hypothetical protein
MFRRSIQPKVLQSPDFVPEREHHVKALAAARGWTFPFAARIITQQIGSVFFGRETSMDESQFSAVLTGDLVKSSRLPVARLSRTRTSLLAAVDDIKRWHKGLVRGKSEFFRGDSWQVFLADPAWALRVALFLRARMKSREQVDTRIAIGIGTVQSVSRSRVSLSSGEAFRLSGESLDRLAGSARLAVALSDSLAGETARWLPVVMSFCDTVASQWKPKQSEIVSWALHPGDLTFDEIAARLTTPVSKQAVAKSLSGAGWSAVKSAIDRFEETSWSKHSEST